jgi:DNA-binding protein HU-beta
MNKKDFIKEVSVKSKMTMKDAEDAVNNVLNTVIGSLRKNDCVKIAGFGNFKKTLVNVTTGINPKTGKKIAMEPYTRVVFSASKKFKETINSKKEEKPAKKDKKAKK